MTQEPYLTVTEGFVVTHQGGIRLRVELWPYTGEQVPTDPPPELPADFPELEPGTSVVIDAPTAPQPGGGGGGSSGSGGATNSFQPALVAEAIGVHRVVVSLPDGIHVADPLNPVHQDLVIGLATVAGDANNPPHILTSGYIRDSGFSYAPGPLYVGAGGFLVSVPPLGAAWLQQVAVAMTPTEINVDLQDAYGLD